ncbi:hypothetical protein ACQE98_00260 [Ornithinimicrobium sp. W1679]|uniref:hypothetical protein n=1 Tax=Ornithinimicrobium sp. W1679 TaxID=3418770 RepID=UPI003CF01EF3
MRRAATGRAGRPRPGARAVLALTAAGALLLGACGGPDEPAETDGTAATATGQAPADDDASAEPTRTAEPAPTTDDPGDDANTTEDDMDPGLTPIPVPGPALPTGPVPDSIVQSDAVQEAIAAEAARQGVEPEDVEVVGYAEVTWPDGSLGCPKPGMMYTQALVPGRQLILAVDGQTASYHASREGSFSYCSSPLAPAQGGSASS